MNQACVAIYETYSGPELEAAITKMRTDFDSGSFTSAQRGSKAYNQDLGVLQDKLEAAVFVRNSRKGRSQSGDVGHADFSKGIH